MTDLRSAMADASLQRILIAKDLATAGIVSVTMDDTLNTALKLMAEINVRELPVVSGKDSLNIAAMISRKDITRAYHIEIERKKSVAGLSDQYFPLSRKPNPKFRGSIPPGRA